MLDSCSNPCPRNLQILQASSVLQSAIPAGALLSGSGFGGAEGVAGGVGWGPGGPAGGGGG